MKIVKNSTVRATNGEKFACRVQSARVIVIIILMTLIRQFFVVPKQRSLGANSC